ncbi:DUF2207 domain-containing protein [Desemzia sp. RIT804]|nr:DUF2207 domain-containing protein [Desemzia sp. RIT 804]
MSKATWTIGLGLLINLTFTDTVLADNEMANIDIEVELQEDGSGIVTERRQMSMDEGTELFIVLEGLQDSELLDFSVAGFEEVADWDSDDSREEKAGKYGVIDTGDGLELVWGIGEYGNNAYEVTYSLSNLVRELEDGQALLWNFDTFSDIPAENLTVEITGPEPFTENDVRFWGFGFEGDIQLVDGNIIWEAAEEVDDSNDVTVLMQFPSDLFQTQANVNMTLEEQRDIAMEGSAYNDEQTSDTIPMILFLGIATLAFGGGATAITYTTKVKNEKEAAGQMRSGAARIRENKNILYEERPFGDDDLAGIAYLLHDMGKGYFEDYFSVYLLKWANEKRINIETTKKDSVFNQKFETVIEIVDYETERQRYRISFDEIVEQLPLDQELTYEIGLWVMLMDAADATGFISDDRMEKWAKKHAKSVEEYANYLIDYSKDYLEENGLIRFEEITVWKQTQEVAIASTEGDKLFDRLVQFDNYLDEVELEDFQGESKRLSVEEFILWSTLYFRSAEITEQFKDLMPEPTTHYEDHQYIYYYWYWNGAYGFRQNWSNGLASGGFHSTMSSGAAGGTGGATSVGGGAGAGGGGGGGAR